MHQSVKWIRAIPRLGYRTPWPYSFLMMITFEPGNNSQVRFEFTVWVSRVIVLVILFVVWWGRVWSACCRSWMTLGGNGAAFGLYFCTELASFLAPILYCQSTRTVLLTLHEGSLRKRKSTATTLLHLKLLNHSIIVISHENVILAGEGVRSMMVIRGFIKLQNFLGRWNRSSRYDLSCRAMSRTPKRHRWTKNLARSWSRCPEPSASLRS